MSIAHRDLKPENLLLTLRGYIKLVDFGNARVVSDSAQCFTFCGTPEYMAPEIVTGEPHSLPVDWWAIGVLLYEMLLGHTPFSQRGSDEPNTKIYLRILAYARRGSQARLPLPPCCFPSEAAALLSELITVNPAKRMTARKCMTHPFFESINFVRIEQRALVAPQVGRLASSQSAGTPATPSPLKEAGSTGSTGSAETDGAADARARERMQSEMLAAMEQSLKPANNESIVRRRRRSVSVIDDSDGDDEAEGDDDFDYGNGNARGGWFDGWFGRSSSKREVQVDMDDGSFKSTVKKRAEACKEAWATLPGFTTVNEWLAPDI